MQELSWATQLCLKYVKHLAWCSADLKCYRPRAGTEMASLRYMLAFARRLQRRLPLLMRGLHDMHAPHCVRCCNTDHADSS